MARATLIMLVAAALCACVAAQTTYLEVKIKWDNSIKETEKATKEILEEIANELCKVPKTQVQLISHADKSTTLNTETHGLYACTGTAEQVTKAAQTCGKNQSNFKDELEDRTTPDQESEGITCTIRSGAVPAATKPAGRKML
jgi:hypothetical protein